MYKITRLLAVLLILYPLSATAQSLVHYDPGYILMAIPEDPHTYAAGAGPAGGFGIAAAANNPAALAWGYPIQGRYHVPTDDRPEFRNLSASAQINANWAIGMGGTWRRNHWRYVDYFGTSILRSDESLFRLTVARRGDSSFSQGVSLSYLRTISTFSSLQIDSIQPIYRRSLAEVWAVSLGVRLHGPWVLDPPEMKRLGRSILVGNYSRPRWSAGLAVLDLPLVNNYDQTYWDSAVVPTRVTIGAVLRPYHGPWFGVALNGSYTRWDHDRSLGMLSDGGPTYSFGTWRAGLGIEFVGLFEAGIALGGGYEDMDHRAGYYAIIGPPFLHLTYQGEGETYPVYYYGGVSYGRPYSQAVNQIGLEFSWPIRYYRHEESPPSSSIY